MPRNVSSQRDPQNFGYFVRSAVAGGVAGCVAKTVVAPLDRVKILFQTSNPDFQKYAGSWTGAYKAGVDIFKQNGLRGLFQGHSVTLLRIFPYAAIKYVTYDQVRHVLMPTRQSETNFKRFAAGSICGLISVCFVYPLDLIRVRLAFITRSYEKNNLSTRGALLKTIQDVYHESVKYKPPPLSAALAASLRGAEGPAAPAAKAASGGISATPISPVKAIRAQIFYSAPILSFYRGFTVTLLGMVPYAGMSFLTWEYLRAKFLPVPIGEPRARLKPTPVANMLIGAAAGLVAQTVSYPLEVIRRRMQVGGLTNPDPRAWLTFAEVVRRIWRTSGWRGFYVGLGIGYVKIVPMTATSFTVWQWGKSVLDV